MAGPTCVHFGHKSSAACLLPLPSVTVRRTCGQIDQKSKAACLLPLPFREYTTMSFTHTLARPARRFLAERLGQLAQRLDQLGRRLREGIAQVVSQTVAEGVHEAVRSALDGKAPQPERYGRERFWNEPEPLMRPNDGDSWRH